MDPTKSEQEQFQVWRDAMSPEIGDDEVRDLMMKAKERMTAMSAPKPKKAKVAEGDSTAIAQAAKRLTDPNDGKTAKLRAAGDKRREDQLKGRDIANRDRTSKDEWGNLKELSNDTLGRYKKVAAADASAADKAGDYKHADKRFSGIVKATKKQFANDEKNVAEKWSQKYKSSINCSNPKGFSQKAHCAGKKKEEDVEEEKQRLDPSCWKGYRKAGTKIKGGVRVNNCVPVSEGVENIMDSLINKIIVNETVQNNRK